MTTSRRPEPTNRTDASRTRHRAKPQTQTRDQYLCKDPNPKIKSSTHLGITIRRGAPSPPGTGTGAAGEAPC